MNMLTADVTPGSVAPAAMTAGDLPFWYHPALCALALPLRSSRESWGRRVGPTAVDMETQLDGASLPAGPFLRLALIQICTAAARTRAPVVDLGNDVAAWAGALGLDLTDAELRAAAVQLERLAGSRVIISPEGGPPLALFDARGRRPMVAPEWRSSVRLGGRFLGSLLDGAIPLRREAVLALWRTPAALDAYAWVRRAATRAGEAARSAGWHELGMRFGQASSGAAAFRTSFSAALHAAAAADPAVAVNVGDVGVEVRPADGAAAVPLVHRVPDEVPSPEEGPAGHHISDVAGRAEAGPTLPTALEPAPTPSEHEAVSPDVVAAPVKVGRPAPSPVGLLQRQTGLPGVIWLRRGGRAESPLVGVTPGSRLDVERLTVLAVEPMVLQVSGGLSPRDFGLIERWIVANRDLIDEFWEGGVASLDELEVRVKPLKADTPR